MSVGSDEASGGWPSLPFEAWRETLTTLHLWSQVAGKVRLALAPPTNHWWHVAFPVTPRGFTTSATPHGERTFQIDFDLVDHVARITVSDGLEGSVALSPRSVADFHQALMAELRALGLEVEIWPRPVEVEPAIPFHEDHGHRSYDREGVGRFARALLHADGVLKRFRGGFIGKSSPVHFFWGSFDLAVTRFSGRTAPEHPGGIPNLPDRVTREAYSHELFSAGWWPGNEAYPEPAFYAYAYPEPEGFGDAPVAPGDAFYHRGLREFLLPWEAVRGEADPERAVLRFLDSTYDAAARLGGWDRAALERKAPEGGVP